MRTTTCIRVLLAAIFVLAGFPVLAQSSDPVADAARKAREDKKTTTAKPRKVYTEDDIPARKPADAAGSVAPTQPSTGDANATPDSAAATPGTTTAPTGNNLDKEEATWRKKFADARARLATLEKELDILQREDEKAQLQYYSDPQKAMVEQNTRKDINDKKTKIEAKKQEIAAQKQAISDMEDDLRKSGGDTGWAR